MSATRNTAAVNDDRAIGALLGHHFGDGLVYLQGARDHTLLAQAKAQGLVSEDGYLTNAGYTFWRKCEG